MSTSTVLFLPGFMCDYRLFSPQVTAMTAAGYRCFHADLSRGLSIPNIAKNVLDQAPRRFAAVGLSMGGLVAFELYRQAPERITHLALLNTTARSDAAGDARKSQLKRVAAGDLDLVLREELKPRYLHPSNRTSRTLDLLENMGSGLGEHVFCSQTMALASRPSYVEMLHRIWCPTLVVGGADDKVCPVDRHEEISAHIPGADIRILNSCGHLCTLEQPDAVNRALLNLLSRPAARLTGTGNAELRVFGAS
ncbi:MAG: alpha/beta fold hydrolase [Pseudomonadota bacterium]